ncbi:unnamed protein product [Prunus brigantina]
MRDENIIMGDENISHQREESGVANQDCQSLDLEALQATSEIIGLVVGEEEESPNVSKVLLGRDEGLKSEEAAKFLKGKMVGCYEAVDQQGLNLPLGSGSEIAKKKHFDSELFD